MSGGRDGYEWEVMKHGNVDEVILLNVLLLLGGGGLGIFSRWN